MPTYSYRCTECGHAFDIQQAFTDDSLTQCPSCGGKLRKLFSAVGVTFNGSGFYRTDSRGGGSTATSSSESASSSEGSSGGSSGNPTSGGSTSGGSTSGGSASGESGSGGSASSSASASVA
jgi:putative FmdB family regulatory protein